MIEWGAFSPKALDFLENSNARLNILHGSVRSSKTVNCTVRWLDFIATGPKGDVFMLGRTVATLQRNVLNDLFDLVGPKNYKWLNKQQGELQVFNRRIYCIGANNEDAEKKIRGATIAGAYCDEVNLYPESVWNQLIARMSIEGAMLFGNCNPESQYHWFYKRVIKNKDITSIKMWHFTMDDNYNLSEEYKNSLKQMYTGVFYRRLILGEWCAADGLIYDMFDADRHVGRPKDHLQDAIRYFVSCDYGTSSVTSWSLMALMRGGSYYKVKEFYYDAVEHKKQLSDFEFGNEFDKWIAETPEIRQKGGLWAIYIDPSASSWKVELQNRGYRVTDADNSVVNGIRTVGSLLSRNLYTIDPGCVNTIAEYGSYVWDPVQQAKGIDAPFKTNDHACDSDRYALHTFEKGKLSGVYNSK